jgi:hypothetical protein
VLGDIPPEIWFESARERAEIVTALLQLVNIGNLAFIWMTALVGIVKAYHEERPDVDDERTSEFS